MPYELHPFDCRCRTCLKAQKYTLRDRAILLVASSIAGWGVVIILIRWVMRHV